MIEIDYLKLTSQPRTTPFIHSQFCASERAGGASRIKHCPSNWENDGKLHWCQVSWRLDEHLWWVVDPSLRSIPGYLLFTPTNTFLKPQLPQGLEETTQEKCKSEFVQVESCTAQNQDVCTISVTQQPFTTKWSEWGQGTNPQLKRIQSSGGTNHFSFQCIPGPLEMKCRTSDLLPLLYWVVWIHLNTRNANCDPKLKGKKEKKTRECNNLYTDTFQYTYTIPLAIHMLVWFYFWTKFLFSYESSFDKVLKIVWSNVSMEQIGESKDFHAAQN